MKTSRKFLNALYVAVAISGTMMFASCGSDDDEPAAPNPPEVQKVVTNASFTTSFAVNQAFLDTYDIIGKTSDGQPLSFSQSPVDMAFETGEGITTIPMYVMSVYAEGKTLPLTSGMSVQFTLKDGYQVPESNHFVLALVGDGVEKYSDGTSRDRVFKQPVYQSVMGSKIVDYTARINKRYKNIQSTFDETGIHIHTSSSAE